MVPTGPDGDCLRFLAMVHINVRAVQQCYDESIRTLEHQLESILLRSMLPQTHIDKQRLLLETEQALLQLGATAQLASLNRESVGSILAKFDARTRYAVAAAAMAQIDRCPFAADAAAPATGRPAALRRALLAALRALRPAA